MLRRGLQLLLIGGAMLGATSGRAQFGLLEPSAPRPVFFPPAPPIYGSAIPATAAKPRHVSAPRLTPPDGLAEFVGDDFFPALSTRLSVPELNPRLEARLRVYREKRQMHVQTLLNEFVALHDASAEQRERALRQLAETQTPALVALEAEAEQLREDIVNAGIFVTVDWNAFRRWRLGTFKSNAAPVEAEAEFQVVRAAAYYQKGFLPAQRGLLRELAAELQLAAYKARGLPGAPAESDAMYFSPESTRFRLPPNLPAAAREKIGVYNGRKVALKRELREAVTAQDGASAARRAEAFEALAERQWPALQSLEALADEIRGLLAPLLAPVPPAPPPWLPPGLMDSINAYNRDRAQYLLEARQRVDSVLSLLEPPKPYLPPDERLQAQREFELQRKKIADELARDFHQKTMDRFTRLQARYDSIRQLLAIVAEKQTDRKTGRPLTADTLLRQYTQSMEEFATFGREDTIYTNYRLAMFQPGLSPEQRRLLFRYAWAGLAQPMPGGEYLPRHGDVRPRAAP